MVPQKPFSLVEVSIYRRSFTYQNTVLNVVEKTHSESPSWDASFRKEAMKIGGLTDLCNKSVLKARLR